MRFSILLSFLFSLNWVMSNGQATRVIYNSKSYTIYDNKVVQGPNIATVHSATSISSNYKSPANLFKSAIVDFKFSINGKDNEMIANTDHHFLLTSQSNETSVIKFGHADEKRIIAPSDVFMQPDSKIKIRLDMREVIESFKTKGYYTTFNGDKIYKDDFKGVFIAGNAAPLIWDFNNLVNHPNLELKDPDGNGIYETTLILNSSIEDKTIASSWKLVKDISAFPQYHSDYKISDALHNLSLEEMQNAIEPDSTFRTGKEWSGVWTRDISYSIILSMAILQPKVAMKSLMRKVKNGVIIQDTGTGGAYPVSSDRMIWGVAAFEVYKVTGDKEWLAKAYGIIKKSAEDDFLNVYDRTTGMVHGESSFLDWREETYPRWMQPADIYQSECIGTNAVHYQVNRVLSQMAGLLGADNEIPIFLERANTIRNGINSHLWNKESGYFGQYIYGRNFKSLSPRAEALGEALSILFDVADHQKQQSIIKNTPVTEFGIPCIYPQIPGILPYHNNAIWPFVASYWAMAAAKGGDESTVLSAIASVYRAGTLFLTNKENVVATNGDYAGTQINSSNMLWSLSGNIALVYKVLFGIQYNINKINFTPFVPKALKGLRTIHAFRYRNAVLDISIEGYGNVINKMIIDGKETNTYSIPSVMTGFHSVKIDLSNRFSASETHIKPVYFTIETPVVTISHNILTWAAISGAQKYGILKNGRLITNISQNSYTISDNEYGEYQVVAIDKKGNPSFNSEPIQIIPDANLTIVELEHTFSKSDLHYSGFTGSGFVEISKNTNTNLDIPLLISKDGTYAIDMRYANGNGPINTENKCAIRTMQIDHDFAGTIVFPQRGKGEWSDWGYTNSILTSLTKGPHTISIILKESNDNMNGEINQAMIDHIRIIKIK